MPAPERRSESPQRLYAWDGNSRLILLHIYMKDRELRLYERALGAGVGRSIECRPKEWRVALALMCQGYVLLVGERSPHGSFEICARTAKIPPQTEGQTEPGQDQRAS